MSTHHLLEKRRRERERGLVFGEQRRLGPFGEFVSVTTRHHCELLKLYRDDVVHGIDMGLICRSVLHEEAS